MKPVPHRLLAKWSPTPDQPRQRETLVGHLSDVLSTIEVIIGEHGATCLASLGLSPERWMEPLRRASGRAAAIHDLGKANDQFQAMVRKQLDTPQAIRHEVIGALVALHPSGLGTWLFGGLEERDVILAAVIGHHLQAEPRCWFPRQGSGGTKLQVFTGHPDFIGAIASLGEKLGLPAPPEVPPIEVDLVAAVIDGDVLEETVGRWWKRFSRRFTTWPRDGEEQRFLALIKALLISADVAGSAVPRSGADPANWTREVLGRVATAPELREIATLRLDGKPVRPFQGHVAASEAPVTLARAGCGSGKTTAAYLWASQRGDRKKLFFCYPTTGTATEGFADYVLPGSIEGRLIHGRAEVDLERLLTSDGGLDPQDCQPAFEALSTWDVPLAVCTADTVLGLIQNNRRGLCSVPAIGQGAFVFDEVHAYDEQMFGALLRFLRVFTGAPVLLMTASLPVERRRALVEAVGSGRLLEVFGPRELEDLPRYQIRQVNPEQALSTSLEEMSTGSSSTSTRKVLWVSNTVGRCVERGRALEAMGSAVLPYHSRYRYSDRVDRHRQVVDSFKTDEPALAVTTQVCEMSLDLSASLLVTDLAPVSALIQRLGRLNRRATSEEPGQPRRCLVLEPEFVQPYTRAELDQAQAWLEALGEGDLSQADLTREFEALGTPLSDRSVRSAWLDGGPAARLEPLRDAGLTAPFIRGEDRKQAELGREERIRLEVPMTIRPVEKEIRSWSRVGPSWVAPPGRITYCPKWGAEWKL